MWCSYSNVVVIPKHGTPSCCYLPRRRRHQNKVGELGERQSLFLGNNLESKEDEKMSGSDVLLALERASANKKKKNNNSNSNRGSSSSSSLANQDIAVEEDYTDVRPLFINDNWYSKLDELEKCLRELSDAI